MEHLAKLDAAIMSEAPVEAHDAAQIRLLVVGDPFWLGINEEMGKLGRRALDKLAAAGVALIERNAPELETLTAAAGFPIALFETERNWQLLASVLAGLSLAEFADRIASPDVRGLYQQMARGEMPGEDAYRAAMDHHRPELQKALAGLFSETGADAIVFPTLARSAPPIDETEMIDIDGQSLPLFPTMTRRELTASIAALPALTLPAGLCGDGLPFGLELVGPSGSDRRLLAIGRAIEAKLSWKEATFMNGRILSLSSYPIKGLSAQGHQKADLKTGDGFPGDRLFGFAKRNSGFDPSDPQPLPKHNFIVLLQHAKLAGLETAFDAATRILTIRTKDSRNRWNST